MKLLNIIILLLLLCSCSELKLIKYDIISDGSYEILYGPNIRSESFGYWTRELFTYRDIMIYVKPTSGEKVDVRVFYIDDGPLRLYDRQVSDGAVLIKGKL